MRDLTLLERAFPEPEPEELVPCNVIWPVTPLCQRRRSRWNRVRGPPVISFLNPQRSQSGEHGEALNDNNRQLNFPQYR